MKNNSQLVFYGEVLPGHDPVTVKASLASLLKLQANQIDTVFSGRRIVLRKGLSADESGKYLLHRNLVALTLITNALDQIA